MRGFVITLDSIIALILAISLIIIASSPVLRVRPSAWSDTQVKRISMDFLTILDKSGVLARAVGQNSSAEMIYFMSSESSSLCMKARLSGSNGYIFSAEKPGCDEEGARVFLSKRAFVSGNNFYTAELRTWER
jgi:hypothetical protein